MLNLPNNVIELPTNLHDLVQQGQYKAPENTLDVSVAEAIKAIGEFCYLLVHPKSLWCRVVPYSKVMLLFICLVSFSIYTVTKSKNARKITVASPFIYLIVKYLDLIIQRGQ